MNGRNLAWLSMTSCCQPGPCPEGCNESGAARSGTGRGAATLQGAAAAGGGGAVCAAGGAGTAGETRAGAVSGGAAGSGGGRTRAPLRGTPGAGGAAAADEDAGGVRLQPGAGSRCRPHAGSGHG